VASFEPFLERIASEVGTLQQAAQAQQRLRAIEASQGASKTPSILDPLFSGMRCVQSAAVAL
jgi:hypothetical protein